MLARLHLSRSLGKKRRSSRLMNLGSPRSVKPDWTPVSTRERIMNRISLPWIGMAACLVWAASGCASPSSYATTSGGVAPQRISASSSIISPSRRDIVGYALLQGQLYWPAGSEANVFASNPGAVSAVKVPIGSRVERGQVLVTLQSGGSASDTETAKSSATAAKAAYTSAQLQYGAPVNQAKEQLEAAQQAEREARTGADSTAIESATQARQAAETALQQARGEEITNMATYRQQLDQATIAAKSSRSAELLGEITAPISGTLLSLSATVGSPVGGSNAMIGRIVNLNEVRNANGSVKPASQIQRVGIRVGSVRGALSVPVSAVRKDALGKSYVTDANGAPIEVQTGLSDGQYIEIKSGLSEDSKIKSEA
jgi:multidrug efflux pump subunit AcrA (membrane-fusion protein)